MEHEEPRQRGRPDVGPAARGPEQGSAHERHVLERCGTDGDGPIRQLVPGEEVTREGARHDEEQERHPHEPVSPPRREVPAPVEDAEQVEEGDEHEPARGPVVCVPDQGPEGHVIDERHHRSVGPLRRGLVHNQ